MSHLRYADALPDRQRAVFLDFVWNDPFVREALLHARQLPSIPGATIDLFTDARQLAVHFAKHRFGHTLRSGLAKFGAKYLRYKDMRAMLAVSGEGRLGFAGRR